MSQNKSLAAYRIGFFRKLLKTHQDEVTRLRGEAEVALAAVQSNPSATQGEQLDMLDQFTDLHDGFEGLGHKMFIVGLASLVEAMFKKHLRVHAPNVRLRERANWGDVQPEVKKLYGIELVGLPGYEYVDMARELSNAYKHRDGWLDLSTAPPAVKKWADDRGKVDYGRLPIDTFVDRVEAFLTALEEQQLP